MEAVISNTPLGGVLDRAELASVMSDLADRAPHTLVRWDSVSMPVQIARDAQPFHPSEEVVALMLMDGERPALALSSRRPFLRYDAA